LPTLPPLLYFNLSLVSFSPLVIGVAKGDNVATNSGTVAAVETSLTNDKIRVETGAARSGEAIVEISVILVEVVKGRGDNVVDYYRVAGRKFRCLKWLEL
jgi:hypothetical protein